MAKAYISALVLSYCDKRPWRVAKVLHRDSIHRVKHTGIMRRRSLAGVPSNRMAYVLDSGPGSLVTAITRDPL